MRPRNTHQSSLWVMATEPTVESICQLCPQRRLG
jgi:hypothetical protein